MSTKSIDFNQFQRAVSTLSDIARAASSFDELQTVIQGYEDARTNAETVGQGQAIPSVKNLLKLAHQGFHLALPKTAAEDERLLMWRSLCDLIAEANAWAVDEKDFLIAFENAFDSPFFSENLIDYCVNLELAFEDGIRWILGEQ